MLRIHNKYFRNLFALATCLTLANPVGAHHSLVKGQETESMDMLRSIRRNRPHQSTR